MHGVYRTAALAGLSGLLALPVFLLSACTSDSGGSQPEADDEPGAASTSSEQVDPTFVTPPAIKPSDVAPSAQTATKAPAPAGQNRFAPGGPLADGDLGKYYVSMSCDLEGKDLGTMTFELWTEAAPITTRNFLRLCDEGFYNGIAFHRIMRGFMVQGGDPTGTGAGSGPHGTIKAEFSEAPERRHGYGVLSMARGGGDINSASAQFFLCCDESPPVWNLDGSYASFARMTSGVETLEAVANVPVRPSPRGEASSPLKKVSITTAVVIEGSAPQGGTIERPPIVLDLGGEPEKVVVRHILISFEGCGLPKVTRTKEEAEALANKILTDIQGGAEIDALARKHSDDPIQEGDDTPGEYGILNTGVRDSAGERKMFEVNKAFQAGIEKLRGQVSAGTLPQAQFQTEAMALQAEARASLGDRFMERTGLVPAFGDLGFSLTVGDVGIAAHDAKTSPFGYHIIKRME